VKKTCTKCGSPGPFNRDRNRKDGLNPWCKVCQNASTRKATDPEKHRQKMVAYRASDPSRSKNYNLKYRYGIDQKSVTRLLEAQGGACVICQSPLIRMTVDHDHLTGRVRGLLCFSCNSGLGCFKDNPKLLQAAKDYLARSD
jgi:hypothetical protein